MTFPKQTDSGKGSRPKEQSLKQNVSPCIGKSTFRYFMHMGIMVFTAGCIGCSARGVHLELDPRDIIIQQGLCPRPGPPGTPTVARRRAAPHIVGGQEKRRPRQLDLSRHAPDLNHQQSMLGWSRQTKSERVKQLWSWSRGARI